MSTTKRDFEVVLAAFVKSQEQLVGLAREAANMAISHFAEHGDVAYLQRFHDACRKNFMRRQALVSWACDFMPLVFEGGKFSKNKKEDAIEPDLEGALASDFWDYKPEATVEFYVGSDVIKALNKVIDGFDGGKRKMPANEDATKMVNAAKNAVSRLQNVLAALPTSDELPPVPTNSEQPPVSLN